MPGQAEGVSDLRGRTRTHPSTNLLFSNSGLAWAKHRGDSGGHVLPRREGDGEGQSLSAAPRWRSGETPESGDFLPSGRSCVFTAIARIAVSRHSCKPDLTA